jgi:hypothetical protein
MLYHNTLFIVLPTVYTVLEEATKGTVDVKKYQLEQKELRELTESQKLIITDTSKKLTELEEYKKCAEKEKTHLLSDMEDLVHDNEDLKESFLPNIKSRDKCH